MVFTRRVTQVDRLLLALSAILACMACNRARPALQQRPAAPASRAQGLRAACPWLPAVAPAIELSPEAKRELSAASAACEAGDATGCIRLGTLELDGAYLPANPVKALQRLEPLCQSGDYRACAEAGRAALQLPEPADLLLGAEAVDAERALTPLTRACEHGVLASCRELGAARNAAARPAARAALEKACDGGRKPLHCGSLARLLLSYENAALRERAKQLAARYLDEVLSQCQAKHQEACRELVSVKYPSNWGEFELAERFAEVAAGHEAPPGTEPTVFKVLDLACAAGDRAACIELGAGWAVQGFRAKAEPLLVAACDAGDQRGCLELATFWGMGNPKTSPLLQKACAYGFVSACVSLARQDPKLYRRACQLGECEKEAELEPELTCVAAQRDCAKVLERARQPLTATCRFELLREACEQNANASCGELGEMYRSGSGVAKDPVLAAKALRAACRGPSLSDADYDGSAWCERLAGYEERGDGVVKDSRRAAWGYADLCLAGRLGACDAIERVVGRPFARGAYGPVGVGERRCALLPEGFACEEHGVCRHRVPVHRADEKQAELVPDCVEAAP